MVSVRTENRLSARMAESYYAVISEEHNNLEHSNLPAKYIVGHGDGVVDDSFVVQESAIPELHKVFDAIAIADLCAGG